jgi:hypothetical protein
MSGFVVGGVLMAKPQKVTEEVHGEEQGGALAKEIGETNKCVPIFSIFTSFAACLTLEIERSRQLGVGASTFCGFVIDKFLPVFCDEIRGSDIGPRQTA